MVQVIERVAGRQKPGIYKDERFSDHAPLTIDYDWCADTGKPSA